jgi:cysteinyl-tRNA synthetase
MKINNTLSGKKEEFIPIEQGKIKMYVCGPTVYNYFHIGNARPFLFFDVVRRYFEYLGYEVTYVQNITDIDDKIIDQSLREGIPFQAISSKYIQAYYDDLAKLGIKQADFQPKATSVVPQMISLIKKLIETGHAYEMHGDVYFSVESYPEYGRLSGKKIEDQRAGARVEENMAKKHPGDFTLWKKSKPGEPVWQSPWGEGRPGWHTECVVLSQENLGETFDIHGGGIDLVFPHHENEMAQAECLNHKPLAHYWMHNGFLNIEGDKMSKSEGNFFTAREVLAEYSAEAIRFFFLSKHYRSPIDFSREILAESDKAVRNFYDTFSQMGFDKLKSEDLRFTIEGHIHAELFEIWESKFREAMDDDFNTAKALAILFELNKAARSTDIPQDVKLVFTQLLYKLGSVLGFFQNMDAYSAKPLDGKVESLIQLLIQCREKAKAKKDWACADSIRKDLAALGVELMDTKDGTEWKIK